MCVCAYLIQVSELHVHFRRIAMSTHIPIINPLNAELNPIFHLLVLLGDLTFMGPCIVSIFQYMCICNKIQRYSLFIFGKCSTYFGWYFRPSSGAHTTVSTASGICHAVTAICRYRVRDGTGLSVLWVASATHSTTQTGSNSSTIAVDSSNGPTNTRCCRYSCMRS
jgi:hypothetical protein